MCGPSAANRGTLSRGPGRRAGRIGSTPRRGACHGRRVSRLDASVRIAALPLRLPPGAAVTFEVRLDGIEEQGFVIRWEGAWRAYVNRCRHHSLPLDFGDARLFDADMDALVCCHHGARYRPADGVCVAGPCVGARLTPLVVEERDGALWCVAAGGP